IIAAINGHAVGLGATLALLCDVIIAERSAKIGDPHVKIGVVSGDGGSVIWPLLCGPARAKQYLMTGDLLLADEAERIGLVNMVVDDGDAVKEANAFAERLLSLPPLAVKWTKFSVNKLLREQVNLVLDTSLALEGMTILSDDHKEATSSFLEKRPPTYAGR
ncbi:MAG: enoyl-CoA hydratase/isomerase family protein, partial [Chloroflexota bacterium]|nr:enoyl-CoA hydratase/isomerase family protein [Chloroflexota bacterium]